MLINSVDMVGRAPEKAAKSDTSVDCWAAGLIMCCLLSGSLFIDSKPKMQQAKSKYMSHFVGLLFVMPKTPCI